MFAMYLLILSIVSAVLIMHSLFHSLFIYSIIINFYYYSSINSYYLNYIMMMKHYFDDDSNQNYNRKLIPHQKQPINPSALPQVYKSPSY